jgi:serine/threonine protein kinase
MNYTIISELGHGMFGTVYKIKYKDKYFAMKIEHVLDTDNTKDIKSAVWREIDFMENFARKHRDQIMQMYHYDFMDSCEHTQKYSNDLKNFDKYNQNKMKNLAKSKTCIRKIYELLDGKVQDIIYNLTSEQIYSFIVQIALIVKTLEKAKYIHGDFHSGNIGYIKTNQKYIKYGKLKIPTFGYIYKAIDLGSIMHPTYKLSNREKKWYKNLYKRELISSLITSLINQEAYWDFVDENNIKLNLKKDMDKIKKSKVYNTINTLFPDIKNEEYKFNLIEIMYPDKFQQIMFGKKYTNTLKHILYIDIFDIIFMYKCNFNCDKIVEYFYEKLI